MDTISIKYCAIPTWLQAGDFYRNLKLVDSEDVIIIPADCFIAENIEASEADFDNVDRFCQLVRVILYWQLDEMPSRALFFFVRRDTEVWQNAVLSVPGAAKSKLLVPLFETSSQHDQVLFKMTLKTLKLELILEAARKLQDTNTATDIAAEEGNLQVLQHLHEQGFSWNEQTCWEASRNGHLACLQYARENSCPWDYQVYRKAAYFGHLHIMQYAHEQGLNDWHTEVCVVAAQEGHLACLQFAHDNGCPWDYEVYTCAAIKGQLHIMQYAHSQGLNEWHVNVCKEAALAGKLDCLRFAHDNGCPWDSRCVRIAAQEGHVACLQYLLEQGCPVHEEACNMACLKGHLECLRLLHEYNAPWDEKTSYHAARCANVSCLRYLRENGCPWDTRVYESAAGSGHLHILQYAHDHGLQWHKNVCIIAAQQGHLNCLQFAHDNGCPWDWWVYMRAAEHDHLHIMQYACAQGLIDWHPYVCKCAAANGQLACLQYAHENGCPWDKDVYLQAADNGHLSIMQYAHQQGLRDWHPYVCANAAMKGHLGCLEFAHENGCPWDEIAVHGAARENQFSCFQYLISHGCPFRRETCNLVCQSGRLPFVTLLHQHNVQWDEVSCYHAAMSPGASCLQFLHENGCPWDEKTPFCAVSAGQLATLRYALDHGCMYDRKLVEFAAGCGSFECLQYLVEEQQMRLTYTVFEAALHRGDLACLKYLVDKDCPYWQKQYVSPASQAAKFDQIFVKDNPEFTQCVRYAVGHGWKADAAFCKYISTRDATCLAYLQSEGLFVDCISIKYCDIPDWLQAGDFYKNLSADDPTDTIDIPAECFTKDNEWTEDKSEHDFCQLVRVAMFWMLDEIPVAILEACNRNGPERWQKAILSVPGAEESRIFAPLIGVYPMEDKIPFEAILKTGKLELIMHAAHKMRDKSGATLIAAGEGNLAVLKHLYEQGFELNDTYMCWQASAHGHLDCLQYAREKGCSWDYKIYGTAAERGHLHIMKYAHQQGLEWHPDVCKAAAFAGHLTCLQFARENGCPWNSEAVRNAAENGHLDCLQYLLAQGCPLHDEACNAACAGGHLDCLQLLHVHNASWNETTCASAARCADLSCLQYLYQHGCPWDDQTTSVAVYVQNVSALRFAMERDCPYKRLVMTHAVQGGSIECLQYLVEELVLCFDDHVLVTAVLKGSLPCVQYLIDQGCPFNAIRHADVGAFDDVFVRDNPEFTQCVQYAVERGWEINAEFCTYIRERDAMCVAYLRSEVLFIEDEWALLTEDLLFKAAITGQIGPLRSLFERGCPYNDDVINYAPLSRSVECLQYLVEEQLLCMDETVFMVALLRGNLAHIQYLMDQGCPYLDDVYSCDHFALYEVMFIKGNPEFTQCVRFAVERGWKPGAGFCDFVSTRDAECTVYLKSEELFV